MCGSWTLFLQWISLCKVINLLPFVVLKDKGGEL